ncbi:MAG: carbohydrate-binding domain-containing protein [Muribaculaceae bacterium]|nr:carbohydrate-binding domain-containing protein [Muribaculaceae bacterium]
MNRLILAITATLLCSAAALAQTFHVRNGNVTYSFPAEITGEMVFNSDRSLTINSRSFALNADTEMWTDQTEVENNVVTVIYSGDTASVNIAGNIAQYVDAAVTDAHVTLTHSDDVAESTCGEITYRLSGTSSDGSFALTGSYKAAYELSGLNLANTSGAALNLENGKRNAIVVKSGTVNSLTDGASGAQKGCIACKGHLEFKGEGELTVNGNASHAIYAKEYIELKNCTVNVVSAVKDGLNCNQYFAMGSGTLNISGTGDDGIQVSYKDETDREAEDTGSIIISGGKITANVTADAAKALKCEERMEISGGTFDITVTGDGIWDDEKTKTKASACLASDENMTINGGDFLLTATGGGGNSVPSSSSGSVQPYVSGRGTVTADHIIKLTDAEGATLAEFTVPSNYKTSTGGWRPGGSSGSSVLITCPGLTSGTSYTLNLGTATTSVSAQVTGKSGPGRPF